MRTMNWDAIAASTPLDAKASIVRDGIGEHYVETIAPHVPRWPAPPRMKALADIRASGQEIFTTLVGKRFGRLVCIGVWADSNRKKGAVWVCRCDCGYYEGRKAKALTGPFAQEQACQTCNRLTQLQRMSATPSTKAAREVSAAALDKLAAKFGGRR